MKFARYLRAAALVVCCALMTMMPLQAQNQGQQSIRFTVQFFNQSIYYQGDSIQIRAVIRNESSGDYHFRIADQRMFSLDFDVRTLSQLTVRNTKRYSTTLTQNMPIYVRDVTLHPGEEFAFSETLNDYVEIPSGVYTISAYFYPDLRPAQVETQTPGTGSLAFGLSSNRLSLTVRPAIQTAQGQMDTLVAAKAQEVMRAQNLSPDAVVEWTLEKRSSNQKEAFFLYLDPESLFIAQPGKREVYLRMSASERSNALRQFNEELWNTREAGNIGRSPTDWDITKTEYQKNRGEVTVIERFRGSRFTEVKEFTYTLERRQDIWYIIDYSVTNKGTEASTSQSSGASGTASSRETGNNGNESSSGH